MNGDTVPTVGVWVFPNAPAPGLVDLARHVEALGLDELWVGDEGPARDPFAVLAAAAVVTDRIRLAVGVTNPYVRHPGVAAASMLTIHELSGGRAVLGVGAGGQISLSPFGLRASKPVDRVSEFLDIASAVAAGTPVSGYSPPDVAVTEAASGAPLPLFVGARGPRLNRLASQRADGAFVAGMPPFRYPAVVGWARSVRPIDIALYPSVAFTDKAVERHRPEMVWSLLDAPPEVRKEIGLESKAVSAAAEALRNGDPEPARTLVDDTVLDRVMLVGRPAVVGRRLAELVREHRPASVGLALLQDDLHEGVSHAAEAFAAMTAELRGRAGGDGWSV
ncbi:MAG: LLM class flavin-dependent oxidoreductase [Acidimicrobiaceae bacterium]|nr:LLM class flavin-dependent oxidoreductase [Acidimicrobiaceae bacterium]